MMPSRFKVPASSLCGNDWVWHRLCESTPVPPKRVDCTSRSGASTSPPLPDGPRRALWPVKAMAPRPTRPCRSASGRPFAPRRWPPGRHGPGTGHDLRDRLDGAEHLRAVADHDQPGASDEAGARYRPGPPGLGCRSPPGRSRSSPALSDGTAVEARSCAPAGWRRRGRRGRRALDGQIERVGGVRGEDHPLRVRGAEEGRPPAGGRPSR